MPKQVVNLSDTVSLFRDKVNIISTDLGWRGDLTTTDKTDFVSSINELAAELGTITSAAMGTAASSVSSAIAELQSEILLLDSSAVAQLAQIGDLAALDTTAKNSLVAAINELDDRIDSDTDFRNKVSATDAGGDGSFGYDQASGVFTYTGPSAAETRAHFSAGTNTTFSTGSFNISNTTIRGKVSVTDAGGDGSLAYNNSTGVLTYTGPSASETRAHFSGGTEIGISSGTINHSNVSRTDTTSTDAPSYGGTFEAVTGITTNARGHVTAIDVSTVTIPASDNTDTVYTHPNHTGDVTSSGDGATTIANNAVTQDKMADDAVGSAELKSVVSLVIYNSAGTAVKTLYGAGS